MFDLGAPELIIILLILLLLFGGKKLPDLARSIGESARAVRKGFDSEPEAKKPAAKKPASKSSKS